MFFDLKNFLLATFSSSPTVFFAMTEPSSIALITSIVLPVVLFLISKTVDVLVQIYLKTGKRPTFNTIRKVLKKWRKNTPQLPKSNESPKD